MRNAVDHPLYGTWCNMRQRCNCPTIDAFENYGYRGIYVCKEWDDFWVFVRDMGPRPEGTTLDRKDNDGPYCKENCKWSTREEQNNNKRERKLGTGRIDTKIYPGVRWYHGKYYAKATVKGVIHELYAGNDLFEAVCARKSFEKWQSRGGVIA